MSNRHQEVFNKISDMLEIEYDDCAFQEMCYELAKEIDELREVIRACAAGPWRYDVENAPKDGSEFFVWYETEDNGHQIRIVHWYEPFKNFRDRMDYGIWPPAFKAFAVPNPPQVTT